MGRTLSRRKLAEYIAGELQTGDSKVAVQQVAAYLVETKQRRSVDLLVRDVEEELAKSGLVVADITSARPLSAKDKAAISELLEAKDLKVRESIDPSVIGGVRVEIAGGRLDATLKHKIDLLKETGLRRGTK